MEIPAHRHGSGPYEAGAGAGGGRPRTGQPQSAGRRGPRPRRAGRSARASTPRSAGLHAEAAALEDSRARGEDPAGATIYVTLEPCAHHGRQPPCAEAIVDAGIARVVIASDDPSENAAGRGPGDPRATAGIEVEFADRRGGEAARLLNQPFRKQARTGRPLVTLKPAITLDGRTATAPGDSRWISGEESRAPGPPLARRVRRRRRRHRHGARRRSAAHRPRRRDPAPAAPRRLRLARRASRSTRSSLGRRRRRPSSSSSPPTRRRASRRCGRRAPRSCVGGDGDRSPPRSASSAAATSPRSFSRAARPSPRPSSTPDEIDELRSSSPRSWSADAGAQPGSRGRGATTASADATRALRHRVERSGDDLLIRRGCREW